MINEERKYILFQIDMQLYDEFNDKFCEMNDNLGTVYSYKDLDDLEKLEKETEIKLLRQAIEKQQKEIEELKKYEEGYKLLSYSLNNYISKDKIKAEIEELQEDIKYSANPLSIDNSKFGIKVLQSLLKEE